MFNFFFRITKYMDNIFTLNKNSVFLDDTEPESINIDDLYEKKRERDMSQLRLFNKMLSRVHARIKLTSRQANAEKMCWFVVPEFIWGYRYITKETVSAI